MHEPERLSGPIDGIWLLVFSLPLFLSRRIARAQNPARRGGDRRRQKRDRDGQKPPAYRNVGAYLLARLFFNDGMTAVLTFGGIYASSTFHWGPIEMLIYGIELSVFAVLGGFVGGWLDNHLGSKRAIFVSIGGTALVGLSRSRSRRIASSGSSLMTFMPRPCGRCRSSGPGPRSSI